MSTDNPMLPEGIPQASSEYKGGNGVHPQPLHRLGDVRRRQGVSLRRVARELRMEMRSVREEEESTSDLSLSQLYRWQKILDVPISELLIECDAPLSPPVLERARMIKLMKTVAAIIERADSVGIRRMAETLANQLLEIMPELDGVAPWHAVGQRRTLDEYGRVVERSVADSSLRPSRHSNEG